MKSNMGKGSAMPSEVRSHVRRFATAALAATAILTTGSTAFAATNLGTFDFWTAWTDTDGSGTICYVSSTPQTTEPSNVSRGDIHFIVTRRPTNPNEIATIVGYPIHETEANASVSVDGRSYPMVTQGEAGWLASIEDEAGFVGAMRAGATMVVRATSQRGTDTVDTYSLRGVTAALNKAVEECPN